MITEELMIGDWVDCHTKKMEDGGVLSSVFAIVIGIDYESNQVVTYENGKKRISMSCNVSPIRLTSEILEKFGFEKHKGKDKFLGHYYDLHHGYDILRLQCECDNVFKYHIYYCQSFEVRYVHELQHLLKFCKLEETIEL